MVGKMVSHFWRFLMVLCYCVACDITLVSNIPINSTPIVSPITKVMGPEKTVSNSLDSVYQIPKLKVNKSRRRKKQMKRKTKMLPVLEQVKEESMSNTRIFLESFFKFLIAFMKAVTSIMNSPTGILWGIVFLLALHPQLIRASPVPSGEINSHSSLDTILETFQNEKSFVVYTLESYDASSFTFPLKEVKLEEFNGMDDACRAISAQHELCLNHPGSCQTSKITANNFEEAIKIHTRSLVDLNRVCEMKKYPDSAEIISRCHQNLTWSQEEFATKKFSFFTELSEGFTAEYLELERGTRIERFIISTPILIGTAIGTAAIATAGVTAVVVAKNKVQGVIEAEKIHREEDIENSIHNNFVNLNLTGTVAEDIDNFRTSEDWSSLSTNAVSHARSSSNVINHLFSKAEIFQFSHPQRRASSLPSKTEYLSNLQV